MPRGRPGALRARPVRRLPRHRRRRAGLHAPRPTRRCGWRSTTGAGRACRSSSAPASACRSRRPSCAWSSSTRRGWPSTPGARASPSPMQLVVKLDPTTGVRLLVEAQRGDACRARAGQPRPGVRRGGRRGADPVRGAAARRDARRRHALHAPGRRRGGVADHGAAARGAAAGASLREGQLGTGGGRRAGRRAAAAGTSRGWRHERRRRRAGGERAAERRRAVAVPADRRATGSSRTATPGALVAPDGGDRLAVRAALRLARACSARCSTARPATSASAPFGVERPVQPALRARDQRARDDLARRRAAGSSSATRCTMGPRRSEDTVTPHTRPPDRRRRRAHARAHGALHRRRRSRSSSICEPVFDYGRVPGEWALVGDDRHAADATGRRA